jgi:hypothetical protein
VKRPGNSALIQGPVESWSPIAWTLIFARNRARSSGPPERLGEVGRAAPDEDPDGAGVGPIHDPGDPFRGLGVLALADALLDGDLRAGDGLAGPDDAPERLGGGVAVVVEEEVRAGRLVGVDDPAYEVGPGLLAVAKVGGGDEGLDVEVVGIEHQADERLAVVGLGLAGFQAADVGEDDQAGPSGGGWLVGRGRRGEEEAQADAERKGRDACHASLSPGVEPSRDQVGPPA